MRPESETKSGTSGMIGDDDPAAQSAPASTLSPASDRWLPYYAAAEREAQERSAKRVRREHTAFIATRLLLLGAAIAVGAFYGLWR